MKADKIIQPTKITSKKIIVIVPLGDKITRNDLKYVATKIKPYIDSVRITNKLGMPKNAYNKARNRYRADSLIKWMNTLATENEVYIGLTNYDISTTKYHYKDWGVMGLAYRPGKAAIASSYRLRDKRLLWKIAIHELGHTKGLKHCETSTCYMRDAKGGDPTSYETDFCENCKSHLRSYAYLPISTLKVEEFFVYLGK